MYSRLHTHSQNNIMENGKWSLSAKDVALVGMMVAVIEVCKVVLMGIPNVELTTFWIIMFSLYFGNRVFFAVPVFILLEGTLFGFGLWWVMYLYVWPLLAVITRLMNKMDSAVGWSILAGIYGLMYGLFCSVPYFVIGAADGGIMSGIQAGFAWFVSGIPFDLIHGISNFLIMLLLYHPVRTVMEKTKGMNL